MEERACSRGKAERYHLSARCLKTCGQGKVEVDVRVPGAAAPCGARGFAFFSLPFSSMMCQLSVVESKSATFPTERPRHLLDDSVLEPHSPARGHPLGALLANGLSRGRVGGRQPCAPKAAEVPHGRERGASLAPGQRLVPFMEESRSELQRGCPVGFVSALLGYLLMVWVKVA